MIYFMCQLDCIRGCLDIWILFLGVSIRVFPAEISIWISGHSKVVCSLQHGLASSNHQGTELNKKAEEGSCQPLLSLLELGCQFSPAFGTPDFQAFGFGLNYTTGLCESLDYRWQIRGLLSFQKFMNQFLIIYYYM